MIINLICIVYIKNKYKIKMSLLAKRDGNSPNVNV